MQLAVMLLTACRPQDFDELAQSVELVEGGTIDGAIDASVEPDAALAESGEVGSDASYVADATTAGSCGDTRSDPDNCGQCGFSCSANFAVAACIESHCARCDAEHGDCNRDLTLGAAGNGCETRIDNDIKNCGGCDVRCIASGYGFATCRAGLCSEQGIKLTSVIAGTQYGGSGGDVFAASQLCPPGEVLIGISGVGTSIAYSLSAHCGRLSLSRTATGYAVKVVPTSAAPAVGGNVEGAPPAYSRLCGSNEVVTAVAGALWIWPGASEYSLRRLSLTCSLVSIDDERRLKLTARAGALMIGDDKDDTVTTFAQKCAAEGAVAGFTGRNGAYIDAIATHCGTLTIGEEPGMTAVAQN